ncbi:SDR family oxidoreductase [Rhabdothermincola salaria]|uniref:SDR family oxidoreductase n=1 Tax=Rhabdothermincola salaria TaxID=2903142 RepID=UPI001E492CC6|nr:SDR family oxidoreductase [Rhabdothermincola salaria]MCD9624304.1 SDR family oxidoreductase [Rhabdothermincola salaria]
MDGEHAGKVVIVTGGSQGVGLGIARSFLDAGASVVTCARSEFEVAPAARDESEQARAVHVAADVRDDDQIDRVVRTAVERFGRLDVLVNNAGGQPPADTATVSPRFIRAIVELNLTAPMIFAQKAYQVMEAQESGGSIINISSQASMPGGSGGGLAPYGAAKAGLNHMTRSLATAWGRTVRVNCVSLGWVRTEAMVDLLLPDDQGRTIEDKIPVGRMGTPDDIGGICLFLASDAASYINGATLWADGGGGFG